VRDAPYATEVKPYGRALLELALKREEIVCFSGDLTRQCEIDLFQDALPGRFINGGMAEANIMGMAGALAREGYLPFVHTFGVFATRRPYDQIAMAIAYPNLPVRIVGFMPGVSSPGGPSHQAVDDVALMRALPNMTVIDVADAVETRLAVRAMVDVEGPVYLRLKRGEIPVMFDHDHEFDLRRARVVRGPTAGANVVIIASGMMLAAADAAAVALGTSGVTVSVVNVSVIKPLDVATIVGACSGASAVVTAENHSIIGGLGSAVAEALAEAGCPARLRRVGIADTFAEGARTGTYLFERYGLATQSVVQAAWGLVGGQEPVPTVMLTAAVEGSYAPV
jgi:transketolase